GSSREVEGEMARLALAEVYLRAGTFFAAGVAQLDAMQARRHPDADGGRHQPGVIAVEKHRRGAVGVDPQGAARLPLRQQFEGQRRTFSLGRDGLEQRLVAGLLDAELVKIVFAQRNGKWRLTEELAVDEQLRARRQALDLQLAIGLRQRQV